jgi:choline dehydrogenase
MGEGESFDHVIVGAGTAGCLLANRLSADPRKRVLLIEAGAHDDYHWIHIPVGYLRCIGNPRTDWMYRTEPEPGLNGRSLRYPRGKVLGGCSSINGMIYMRGQARDYDGWAALTGEDAWRWERCLRLFMRHEDHHGAARATAGGDADFARFHGVGGEWRVERQRLHWPVLEAFAEAAQQAGIPRSEDFNRGDNEGVGYFEVNQRAGLRWNAARAFLRPTCYGRPNFELWTGAQVARLLLEPDPAGAAPLRCIGCEVQTPNGRETVRVRGELLLTAGAIGSPQLLQLSGLGPAALLQHHGIAVAADLPGVGENLQDHLQLRSIYRLDVARRGQTLNTRSASAWGRTLIGLEYALRRRGPMSMAPSQLGAFVRSSAQRRWPDLEYHVQPLSLEAFGEPLHDFDAITASVCHLNPTSRGTVHLRSARFDEAPAIAPRYLSTDADRRVAAEGLRFTRRIVAQPALAPFRPRELKPGPEVTTDEALVTAAGDIGTTIFHPVGTCRMGRSDEAAAVVDPRLRVRGVAGLRVVDASVMPTITSGNPNSPVLMIAEQAAAWIAVEHGHRGS